MPHLKVDIGNGLAGVNVNDLVVDDSVDTLLVLTEVTTDILATNVCVSALVSVLPPQNSKGKRR